jgi:hypothetical protein
VIANEDGTTAIPTVAFAVLDVIIGVIVTDAFGVTDNWKV